MQEGLLPKKMLFSLMLIIALYLSMSKVFGKTTNANNATIIFETSNAIFNPRSLEVTDENVVWISEFVFLHSISSGDEDPLMPEPCQSWTPYSGDITKSWLAIYSSCTEDLVVSQHGYLYDLSDNSFRRLTDLGDDTLPFSHFPQTDGENVIWLQRDERGTYPGFSQSKLYLINLETNEVNQITFAGDRILTADIQTPWIMTQAHEIDDPNSDIITSVYNFETNEGYEIYRDFYEEIAFIKENFVVWTDLETNNIFLHDLNSSETKLAVANQHEHQVAHDLSRGLIYFSVDPIERENIENVENESNQQSGFFNHTQIHTYNTETGQSKLIYENPDVQAIAQIRSSGDQLVWKERLEPTVGERLYRIYYRNLTPFKLFFPMVEQ